MPWFRRKQRQSQRVVVIGLDCLEPSLAFERFADDMPQLSALRRGGAWGRFESVIPPITVPAWACMTTGKTPGELGIYGFRNRADYGYGELKIVISHDVQAQAIWDSLGQAGRESVVIGVPPGFPPKPVHGHAVSCFLTPGVDVDCTHPASLKGELERRFGPYRFDVRNFRTDDKRWLLDQIHVLTEQRFAVAAHLMGTKPWDFFMVVDMGPDRMHHGFWKYFDPQHRRYEPGNPFEGAMRDYYRFLDEQLGRCLDAVPDDAAVFVVSDHGAKRMDGGICLNEWLLREGFLKLKRPPEGVQTLEKCEIDWAHTRAWGEGGYYGRIFLNVQGREPSGVIPPSEYEAVRDELVAKLEALGDEAGSPIGTRVYRPQDLYETVRGIPPDLIALFGDLHWRSVGSVGWNAVHVHENDTGPDDANHAQHGLIVAHNVQGLKGEFAAQLPQLAGTALKLLGQPLPPDLTFPPLV